MSADTTGFGHALLGRPRRLDRHGILAFLRNVALDRRGMLELRRLLADELHRSSIHHLRDDVVLEQLAERYVRGSLSLVLVRPRDVELEGFFVEAEVDATLVGPTNEAGDLRPAPEVPPEYPVLARVESDQILDATSKLLAKLTALLFGTFGREKRPSTLGRELVLLATDQSSGVKASVQGVDVSLDLQLHPQGDVPRPDPQIKDAYIAAAAEIAAGPHPAAKGLIDLIFPLARVNTERRFGNPVTDMSIKNDALDAGAGGAWVEIEVVDDGDPPKPLADTRFRLELRGGKIVEGTLDENGKARVNGIPEGSGRISFPDIDARLWGTTDGGSSGPPPASPAADAEEAWLEIELVDDADPPNPVPGARYRVELAGGKVLEGTLDDSGKARVEGVAPGSGTVTFPDIDGSAWGPG